jgi:hypothetical protein
VLFRLLQAGSLCYVVELVNVMAVL